MEILRLMIIFLLSHDSTAELQIQPDYLAVLRGSSARFNCSTDQLPHIINWLLNGLVVLSILPLSGVLNGSERFSATNFSSAGFFRWELELQGAQRTDEGAVSCQVLGEAPQTAALSVQDRGTVEIVGGNRSQVEGSVVQFQCRAAGWFPAADMSWLVDGVALDCNRSSESQGDVFESSCPVSVVAVRSSVVQCLASVPALQAPERSSAFLSVEPVRRARDATLCVSVSVSGVALLLLLLAASISCCNYQKKKKSSYQGEVARARSLQSKGQTEGVVERHTEEQKDEQTGVAVNQGFNTDGEFSKIWCVSISSGPQINGFSDADVKKHRHVTLV